MSLALLQQRLTDYASRPAIIDQQRICTYQQLQQYRDEWAIVLKQQGIEEGAVVLLIADYAISSIALLLALFDNHNIVVPATPQVADTQAEAYQRIAQVGTTITFIQQGGLHCQIQQHQPTVERHPLLGELQQQAGLILFTSGSTGEPKAVVHVVDRLLSKFVHADKAFRTLGFLLFDHIAGVDTYFYSLFSGGCLVITDSREPTAVAALIQQQQVEVLPTSPTFLNLLLLSGCLEQYDLSSLKAITFGSEPMPDSVLQRLQAQFPTVRLVQKYGVTELGSPRSEVAENDMQWMTLLDDEMRVVDGMLELRASSAMLGYLNAPSPFTEDGWFQTGDRVEVREGYVRVLGRDSDVINVGGEKVYPAEVENILQQLDGVEDVVVKGVANPLTGNMVQATVKLAQEETRQAFTQRMAAFCQDKLAHYKIPQKVVLQKEFSHSERFKKLR